MDEATRAETQFRSIRERLFALPDHVEVFPNHYGGSTCGGVNMSGKASSTIYFERKHNLALAQPDAAAFAAFVRETAKPFPDDYARIKSLQPRPDREGRAGGGEAMTPEEVTRAVAEGALVLDLRPPRPFAAGHVPGAVTMQFNRADLGDRAEMVLPKELPLVVHAEPEPIAKVAEEILREAGYEVLGRLEGGIAAWKEAGEAVAELPLIDVDELAERRGRLPGARRPRGLRVPPRPRRRRAAAAVRRGVGPGRGDPGRPAGRRRLRRPDAQRCGSVDAAAGGSRRPPRHGRDGRLARARVPRREAGGDGIEAAAASSGWRRRLPFRFELNDLLAGLTVAVVLVPQSLAYAQLAGFPAYRGLYAAAIPALVAAPFASSPYLQPGPTAISALLTYAALAPLAPIGSAHYVELGLLLALMVGIVRVAVGLFRAGVVAYLMSQPLLVGFVPAAAILIVASQLPVALGVRTQGHNELYRAGWALVHAGSWQAAAIVVAVAVSAVLVFSKRIHPLFPGVLLAVVGAILYSKLADYGGATLGTIHAGFPPFTTSLPFGDIAQLIVPAFVIALLGFAEASSIARTYAALERKRWDANREFVSQGVANLAAGTFGGFPVGASFSRSALNRLAGAKTNMSGLVTGLAVLAFLPLGFLLGPLPTAVLAATVIVAVVPLIRLGRLVELARLSKPQFAVALTAFALTLALAPHVEWAIVAAIALSIVVHLWRELRIDVAASSRGDLLELIPEGVLWFGTARALEDRFLELLAAHPDARRLVVRLDGLGRIDLTGALALNTLLEDARGAGLEVSVEGSPAHAERILGRVLRRS